MSLRAVYLDRDGVLNRAVLLDGKPYPPSSPDKVEILPGVEEALSRLRAAGYRLVVVTNQPDVGRGTVAQAKVEEIHGIISSCLPLDEIYTCFHAGTEACECRKPKPGMILLDRDRYGVDLSRSFMVGDRWRDIDAGGAAGCRTILIDYGYDERMPDHAPDHRCRSLEEAAEWILKQESVQ